MFRRFRHNLLRYRRQIDALESAVLVLVSCCTTHSHRSNNTTFFRTPDDDTSRKANHLSLLRRNLGPQSHELIRRGRCGEIFITIGSCTCCHTDTRVGLVFCQAAKGLGRTQIHPLCDNRKSGRIHDTNANGSERVLLSCLNGMRRNLVCHLERQSLEANKGRHGDG